MADTIDKIKPISSTTKASILRKTAYALPLRPSESGISAEDIKKAFYSGMTDKEDSIMAELERVISEANIILQTIKDKQSINLGVNNANKALVTDSQGDITTANIDKTPTANSNNLITSGGVHDYPAITFAERERQKSKNLFDFTQCTNLSGVKSNNDGSFDVNSTYYYPSARLYLQLEAGKTYTYSIDVNSYSEVSGGQKVEVAIFYTDKNTATYNAIVSSTGRYSFNMYPAKEVDYIEIRFLKKTPVETTTLVTANVSNIQIEEGNTATDYAPYYGQVSHTGDKEIEFANKQYKKSKNIFRINNSAGYSVTRNGVTATINSDYTITLNGTCTSANVYFSMFGGLNHGSDFTYGYPRIDLDKNKAYTYMLKKISGSYSGTSSDSQILGVSFRQTDGTQHVKYADLSFKSTDTDNQKSVQKSDIDYLNNGYFRASLNVTYTNYTFGLMICEGDDADFENWNGSIVHPSDTVIEFSKSEYEKSKNLYNATTAQTTDGHSITYSADTSELKINGAYTDGRRCMFNTWSLKKGTYTLCIGYSSGSMTRFNAIKFNLYKDTSWTQYATCPEISSSKKQVHVTFTLTEDVYDAKLGLYENLSTNTMTNCVFNYQIVKGRIPDFNFQPYQGGEFVQENTLKQVELKYGTNIENLDNSSMTTLSEYYNYIIARPYRTFSCGVGNQQTSNLKTLLGNPEGFVNYTNCYLRTIGGDKDRTIYQIIEIMAIGLYVNKLAKGYIFYSDNTNKTVTWSGWTILK